MKGSPLSGAVLAALVFILALPCMLKARQHNIQAGAPLRVGLAGLSHDHVYGVMRHYQSGDVVITGIAETDTVLIHRFQKRYGLPDSLFFPSVSAMLARQHPEIVMAFNPIARHVAVVRACAPLQVPVMVEKPLATTVKDAEEIAALARRYQVPVLTNYETSWYASNQEIYRLLEEKKIGGIRKMVAHDGHEGPREIGVSKAFFGWLTDPQANGAGALFDFGCYGANLMTWLMGGQAPLAVTAVTRQIKPEIYPRVDDDATILLEYPQATGIIEASWNWPYSIKDLEVFGRDGYLQAVNGRVLRSRHRGDEGFALQTLPPAAKPYDDYVPFVTALLRGQIHPQKDLSSLENNLIVVRILDAARRSAREGRRIVLEP